MALTAVDVPSGLPARVRTPTPGDPRLARLSLNQKTTERWPRRATIGGTAAAGLRSIGLWREPVAAAGLQAAAGWVEDAGLRVSSLCRGGFFTAADPAGQAAAIADNRAAIEEAAVLRAGSLVLVPGGLPPGDKDLTGARSRVVDALAVDIAEQFPGDAVGVVLDTFHLWWEPGVLAQIGRAGQRIFGYQLADWITPLPADPLLARGMVGDGHVNFAELTDAVAAAGYRGDVEVEIFNADVWDAPPDQVLATMARRYVELVEQHL